MTPLFSKLNFPSFDKIVETGKFEEKSHIVQCLFLNLERRQTSVYSADKTFAVQSGFNGMYIKDNVEQVELYGYCFLCFCYTPYSKV